MDDALLTLLRSVDTPTVCNAIETAEGKRGFNRFTRGTVMASDPSHHAMVGYARTARISAIAPSPDPTDVVRERRLGYFRHMSKGPRPAVAVVEDVDGADAIGAFWGEVNTTVHKALGLDGALTNGVMRDLGDLPEGFPVLAGSVGPSHGFVHVVDFAAGATVFGLRVDDGDFIHADRHGALVIPPAVIPDLAQAIETLFRAEECILRPASKGPMSYEDFEKAWAAFEAART